MKNNRLSSTESEIENNEFASFCRSCESPFANISTNKIWCGVTRLFLLVALIDEYISDSGFIKLDNFSTCIS